MLLKADNIFELMDDIDMKLDQFEEMKFPLGNLLDESPHHLGVLFIGLFLPSSLSLKSKRMILKSFKDRIRKNFNVSLAEIDYQDKWQRSTLGISMINNDRRHIERCLQNIVSFIESSREAEITGYKVSFY